MDIRKSLIILPTDYDDFGGKVRRWEDPDKQYPDCSCGCKHLINLKEVLGNDWGVCANPNSPRRGMLTWQHMSGFGCFEAEKNEDEN
jgi:hypothetical protein